MKKVSTVCILALTFFAALAPGSASAQSEAGGIFLLISPGARAGGMGEAQVAVANDAYAGHWNPAGLAFLEGQELALMHVNWLPGLVDDIYYEFAAYRRHEPNIGTFGAQITYLSLGEQEQTNSDNPEVLGHFRSYMWNGALSYGYQWRENTSLGINLKIYHQFLAPASASSELEEDGAATTFAVDIGFLAKNLWDGKLAFGATLTNMGPNISFLDDGQADPPPTTIRVGVKLIPVQKNAHQLNIAYDLSKMLVARNDNGEPVPFYQALFTSWGDDGMKEELEQIQHNFGAEYWYDNMLALRLGGIYQPAGDLRTSGNVPIPTFGIGIRYQQYGFDFGYLLGDKNHPLTNTMRFSLNMVF